MFGEGDMDINGDDEEPRVTDIDEVSFHFDRPLATIPGIMVLCTLTLYCVTIQNVYIPLSCTVLL